MTGYQEILTDPSYAGQAVVMTYPLIGNYGINAEDVESARIQPQGFIIKELCDFENNWKSEKSLTDYLKENNIPCVAGVDTRMLTKKIRTKGAMNCLITTEEINDSHIQRLKKYKFPQDAVKQVSIDKSYVVAPTSRPKNREIKIGLVDLGVKNGIIRHLVNQGCEAQVFPYNVKADKL